MASIRKDIALPVPAAQVWDALADFYAVHTRVAPGFLTSLDRAADGARVVTFSNGSVASEYLVSSDAAHRRLAYTIPSERMTSHMASVQVFEDGPDACRAVWITDVLPDEIGPYIDGQMGAGAEVMRKVLSADPVA